ncbi:Ig-like domain-containing protein [Persicitalea sp.]|uniref:Ig-like domain-containing protein n=1 Tax=Persicitalea sp. TaxID=3100273 RepID=UPI003593A1E2
MKKYLLFLLSLIVLTRCAQQVAPTGGKKDETPPTLLESNPPNETRNFKGKEIELFFDEYVIVDNIQQKLIITPETENPYTHKQKGTSILLEFKKNFADSTTYTFNFGDGIKDFAERNPVQNLKLVFSTGPTIDSARIYGTVTDLRSDKPIFDALVGLYQIKDTINPEKQKPYYFSRTDSSGRYAIENVQVNNYRLIATDDKNRNQLYNTKDERVAFLDSAIRVGSDSVNYDLQLYLSDVTVPRIQRTSPKVNDYTLIFNKSMDSVSVKFLRGEPLAYVLENPTQLKFFKGNSTADTTLALVVAKDSLGQIVEQEQKISFQAQRGKEKQLDPTNLTTTPGNGQPLARDFKLVFNFNKPIARLDTQRIQLQNDSLSKQPLAGMKTRWNRYRNELTIEGKATARDTIKWIIPRGAITSVEGDSTPAVTYRFPVLKEEDYGILRGEILADTGAHFILELINEEFKVVRTAYSTPYSFTQVPPGKYQLRVIADRNNNRRWDPGIYNQGRQPERIYYFPDPVVIKANFEFDDNNFTLPAKSTD